MPYRVICLGRRIAAVALVCMLCSIPISAERILRVLGGSAEGWKEWNTENGVWTPVTTQRLGSPASVSHYLQSTELGIGAIRSPKFILQGDVIRFWINGWDGRALGKGNNLAKLKLVEDDTMVRKALPPNSDNFVERTWVVTDLKGKEVYIEVEDNLSAASFAWMGLALVQEVKKDIPARASPYRALNLKPGLGTWTISTHDGGNRAVAPYLSSLGRGETGTGVIRSQDFILLAPEIRLQVRGHDGQKGTDHKNRIELVADDTKSVLRTASPPLSDFPKEIKWDVADIQGRRVFLRLVDGDDARQFAWLGLDEVDAGEGFRIKFSEHATLESWTAEGQGSTLVEIEGIPYLSAANSIAVENNSLKLPLGFRAKRLFLLGMTNSDDRGCPCWWDPRDQHSRFFVGDQLGKVRLEYADGVIKDYPLILGEGLWWGRLFYENQEPFTSATHARKVLEHTLRLYPTRPTADGRYLAVIVPRQATLTAMVVEDFKAKNGAPVVVGVTVEPLDGEAIPNSTALPHDRVSRELFAFIKEKPLRETGKDEKAAANNLSRLRNVFYTTTDHFTHPIPIEMPLGYTGPLVRFRGSVYADVMTNIFHANVKDICDKLDTPDGMYHTSTKGAASWGGYEGFGTYSGNRGSYYSQCWTRDMGRSMMEITALGFLDKAKLTADYIFRYARVWTDGVKPELNLQGDKILQLDGHPLPSHICRILNAPSTSPGQGCFENDGHGLVSLFVYNLWRRLPERNQWLRSRWQDVKALGDWVSWQFQNSELSGARETLRTDSECAGGTGYSIYADAACMEALRALAEMAISIDENGSAARWLAAAERLRKGISSVYPEANPKYGKVWTRRHSGWPNQSTILGTVILPPDRRGFAPGEEDPEWRSINTATYQSLVDSYRPFGFYGTAMGYGQGFVTESALLLDKMSDASKMVEWTAKATYNPAYKPFIVPEGCEIEPGGRFWHRTGDLGNGVQEGEIVKVCRLLLGVDDSHPTKLRIFPRMPWGWTEMAVDDIPALIESEGGREIVPLRYNLKRTSNGMKLDLACKKTLPPVEVRLGPFAKPGSVSSAFVDGKELRSAVGKSGDSWWITISIPAGKREFVLHVQ